MDMIYSERGGISVGKNELMTANTSWPVGKIEVYPDRIVLNAFFFKRVFYKEDIEYVGLVKFLFKPGVRIFHRNNKSKYAVFWSWKPENLIERIREAGYKVQKE
ncbi:hypothetical protein KY330_04120 [Candidatus Woesearchaeota archaeon]|nr:hypothetical protein [Candidatus Woesearchaeota archaeon]